MEMAGTTVRVQKNGDYREGRLFFFRYERDEHGAQLYYVNDPDQPNGMPAVFSANDVAEIDGSTLTLK